MSIKPLPGKEPVVKLPTPAWGRVAKDGDLSRAVCFVTATGGHTVSFPVSALSRWEFSPGNPDSLVIAAGKETVTVLGRKLTVVRDALNAGRLLEVKIKPAAGDCETAENETTVSEIRFAVAA
ncbi:hypothetical protein [Geminisphaera colitermitum]|uniref:hypothetical protein n=1 Tax=Geminisphaera colitermitum TaxID=1148786 RepID=UPI0001964D5A|nr:hypothetical protein [Geminisphaera colitermitum]